MAQKNEINPVPIKQGEYVRVSGFQQRGYARPLEKIHISSSEKGQLVVKDGEGDIYYSEKIDIDEEVTFLAGAAIGVHNIYLLDKKNNVIDQVKFYMDCKTELKENDGRYAELLDILYWTMTKNWGETDVARLDGNFYKYFVSWLRDHVHTLKGMKYFYPDLKSGIDLYSDYQREDGMIWDNLMPRNKEKNWWDKRFQYGDFIHHVDSNRYEFKRIPVENDVEYLFIEGLYYTWSATGDDEWMKSHLDNALKALHYSRTDSYRWSEKYKLLKRGFTIDTWDFQPQEDAQRVGGDIMVVDTSKTRFGIMFGDNTGIAAACKYLAEMLNVAGRTQKAKDISEFGKKLKERLDNLAWNGKYYTHHIPIDSQVNRDFGGTDQSAQVSLSNAYSLNRTLSHEQSVAIINSYREIRDKMPETSPGEWYTIYPPFNKGFHLDKWEYMNGGVTPIVAGELAHGAFEHGFEKYAVSILNRLHKLGKKNDNYLHSAYRGMKADLPDRSFIPLNITKFATAKYPGLEPREDGQWLTKGADSIQAFHHIPFRIPNPEKNERTAIQVTKSSAAPNIVTLPIDDRAKSLYFLHESEPGNIAGSLILNYDDGSSYTDYITNEKIGNWWIEPGNNKVKKAWRTNNKNYFIAFYVYGLNNPYPEKNIKSIQIKAATKNNYYVKSITLSDYEVYFPPDMISYGIPDNWGAAAVTYALVEGLMGIKNQGQAFSRVLVAPRWEASDVTKATATAKYVSSGGYLSYKYKKEDTALRISFTGSATKTNVRLLMPKIEKIDRVMLNGNETEKYRLEIIESSLYFVIEVNGKGTYQLDIDYNNL